MPKVRILTYHRVGVPRHGRSERLTVTPERFRGQLAALRALRFRVGDLDETRAWLDGAGGPGRRVVLSFDDGYADLCTHALPRLQERGLPAIVYLVAERNTDDWQSWGERGPLPLMGWSQIREWAGRGVSFGSHSLTHPLLTGLDDASLRAEVTDSKKLLEDRLGTAVHHFCYPYGDCDERVVAAVREAGYRTACTTRRGNVRAGADPLQLPRISVGKDHGMRSFLTRLLLRR